MSMNNLPYEPHLPGGLIKPKQGEMVQNLTCFFFLGFFRQTEIGVKIILKNYSLVGNLPLLNELSQYVDGMLKSSSSSSVCFHP